MSVECPVCGKFIEDDTLVLCALCKTAHHQDCWRSARGCACDSCSCRICEHPAPPVVAEASAAESAKPWYFLDSDGSLVIDYHVHSVETVLALVAFAGICMLAASYVFSVAPIVNTAGWCCFILGFAAFAGVDESLRWRTRLNAVGGAIDRSLRISSHELKRYHGWLFIDELVELHLHEEKESRGKNRGKKPGDDKATAASVKYSLFGLDMDKRRRLLFTVKTSDRDKVIALVEQIAAISDCTIRRFEGNAGPSPLEIEQAVKQRRLEAPLPKADKPPS